MDPRQIASLCEASSLHADAGVFAFTPLEILILAPFAIGLLVVCYGHLSCRHYATDGFCRKPTIRTWFLFSFLLAIPFALPIDQLFQFLPPQDRTLARIFFCLGSTLPLIASLIVAIRCRHIKSIVPFCFGMRLLWSLIIIVLCCAAGNGLWTSGVFGTIWPEIMSLYVIFTVFEWIQLQDLFFAIMAAIGVGFCFHALYGYAGVLLAKTCYAGNPVSWPKR